MAQLTSNPETSPVVSPDGAHVFYRVLFGTCPREAEPPAMLLRLALFSGHQANKLKGCDRHSSDALAT